MYVIIFILIGILLTSLAVWILVVRQDFQSINDVVLLPLVLLLIVGIIIITTAILGCIGASCDKLWPLRVFLGIVILVFILQVVIGILAYVYREETIQNFGSRIGFTIPHYGDREDVRKAVDKVQRYWDCCGIEDPSDWNKSPVYQCMNTNAAVPCGVPDSCCVQETKGCGVGMRSGGLTRNLNQRGCKLSFQGWVERNLDAIGATALAMAILHILGIFFVYMFITKVEDRIRLFKYRKRFYN
jgi:hypothetical protein